MKRTFDLIFSSVLIITLLPFTVILAVIYILSGNWPILFSQERLGIQEYKFRLLKFRTLKTDETFSLQERSFSLGNWLRRTSLDELPQLLNVLAGQMSLVGPRPLPVEYLPYFNDGQKKRFLVKPGITGWAQVNGRTSIDWDKKLSLDIEYVNELSFRLDIKILLKTLGLVFFGNNEESLTEESFIEFCNTHSPTPVLSFENGRQNAGENGNDHGPAS